VIRRYRSSRPPISAKGSFVVAWLDGGGKHIQARLLGGGGDFLANSVNGQADEFTRQPRQRAADEPHHRHRSAAKTIAIGWQNRAAPTGIFARRFPAPQQN